MELTDGKVYNRNQIKDITITSDISEKEKIAIIYQLGALYPDKIIAKKIDKEYLKDLNIKTSVFSNDYIEVDIKIINYMQQRNIVKCSNNTLVVDTEYLLKMLIDDELTSINDITEQLNLCLILNELDKLTNIDNWIVKVLLSNVELVVIRTIINTEVDKLTNKIITTIRNNKHKKYLKLTEKYPDKVYNNLEYINLAFKVKAKLIFQDLILHYTKPNMNDDLKIKYPEVYEELLNMY